MEAKERVERGAKREERKKVPVYKIPLTGLRHWESRSLEEVIWLFAEERDYLMRSYESSLRLHSNPHSCRTK